MTHTVKSEKKKAWLTRVLMGLSAAAVVLLVFLLLFGAFEHISLQAIVSNHGSFSRHTASLSDAMQSLVQSMATQIYHISSTRRLRTAEEITTYDRIYALREVGQYVSASQMLQSIYVFNDARQRVYSTDELFFSATYDSFADTAALAMYLQRNNETRGKLIYRFITDERQLPKPRPSYAFMLYETGPQGQNLPGGILLNLDPAFFRNKLLAFPGDNTIVLDREGRLVAAQDEGLMEAALALLPQVLQATDMTPTGFLVRGSGREKTLVLYAAIQAGEWVALRIMPYEEALPGLLRVRDSAAFLLGTAMGLLALAAVAGFVRVYRPFASMRERISHSGSLPLDTHIKTPAAKLDHILERSLQLRREDALRGALAGQAPPVGLLPQSPWICILAESDGPKQLEKLLAQTSEAACVADARHTVVLLSYPQSDDPITLCDTLSRAWDCRCYYAYDLQDAAALKHSYQTLRELQTLRMFYPGQRVLHEGLLRGHREADGFPAEEAAAVMGAVRNGGEDSMRQAFGRFMGKLGRQSYDEVVFAFKRLLTMLHALEAEGAQQLGALPAESLISAADSIDALFDALKAGLHAAAEAQAQLRQLKIGVMADRVMERIQQGYADPYLSVKQIADEMEITPAYLRRQFFDAHQMSISDYLNQVRVERAQQLLTTTELSVESAALQVGYENHKYFFVLFKKATGMTPRAYANKYKQLV